VRKYPWGSVEAMLTQHSGARCSLATNQTCWLFNRRRSDVCLCCVCAVCVFCVGSGWGGVPAVGVTTLTIDTHK
jgi:hypothetical protein